VLKIHYHSDISYFAGCERPLALLLSSDLLRHQASVSFSFGSYDEYQRDLRKFVKEGIREVPVRWRFVKAGARATSWSPGNDEPPSAVGWLRGVVRLFRQHLHFAEAFLRMMRLLRRIRPDVLHLNNGGYPGATSVRAAAVAGYCLRIPNVVMVVNNMCVPRVGLERRSQVLQDFLVRRSVSFFITASEEASGALRTCLRLEPDKVVVIPNAVPNVASEQLSVVAKRDSDAQHEGFVISCIAMYEPRKGQSVLLKALARLRDQGQLPGDLSVYLVGEGPERAYLQATIEQFKLDSVVHLLGYRPDYRVLLGSTDVLVVPSVDFEDSPLISLEAMQIGVPVVASKFGGLLEQFKDEKAGLLFEPGDADALASVLHRVFEEPNLLKNLSHNGPKVFRERYGLDSFLQAYANVYGLN